MGNTVLRKSGKGGVRSHRQHLIIIILLIFLFSINCVHFDSPFKFKNRFTDFKCTFDLAEEANI